MRRRAFVQALGAGTAAAMLPGIGRGSSQASWADQFRQARAEHPWLSGYQGVQGTAGSFDAASGTAEISGRWPAELRGTLYRNGAAGHEVGAFRYHHWFDGDGMVQSYQMSAEGLLHRASMVGTHKLRAERVAGHPIYPGFGTAVDSSSARITGPDSMNPGNISVLHHHGKLLALWEAGSPWEIDPGNLRTEGIYAFSEDTRGVPFSAHPRVEADGTLWNFGYVSSAKTFVLWHIDARGRVVKMGKVPCDPMGMPHDFIVTRRHLVLLIPPLEFVPRSGETFLDSHHWNPQQPTRVLVVNKDDFDQHQWLELPSQWVFHFGNGWEDEDGVIRFDAARAPDPSSMQTAFRDIMRGEITPFSRSRPYLYRIDTRAGTAEETALLEPGVESEFPIVDPRLIGSRYRHLVTLTRDTDKPPAHWGLNEVSLLDIEQGSRLHWRYPDTQLPEEHLWVPAPGSQPGQRGWIVGTAHDWKNQNTVLNVFDGQALDAGPIASARLTYALPLGLHGKFVAA